MVSDALDWRYTNPLQRVLLFVLRTRLYASCINFAARLYVLYYLPYHFWHFIFLFLISLRHFSLAFFVSLELCRCSSDSRIRGGRDTTIPSPGRSPKQPLPGIGLHDPLHGRQACPEFNSLHQGVGQISPREGLLSCRPLP